MIRIGTVVRYSKTVAGTKVTGTGSITAQASDDAKTVHIKVKTSSHPQLLAVDAYAEVTLERS